MYKLIIFDLDGTLLDTSPGIIHCYDFALRKIGLSLPHNQDFRQIIGGALPKNFEKNFGVPKTKIDTVVSIYRDEYALTGRHMASHYEGLELLLSHLQKQGFFLGVATLKREDFANAMLLEFGLLKYFDCIKGMDVNDCESKASLISACISELGVNPAVTLLVGDSSGDAEGATVAGVDFYAVTYGWGYTPGITTSDINAQAILDAPLDLLQNLR